MTRPRLAVTLGDARGVGPEIVASSLQDLAVRDAAEWIIVGPTGTDVAPAVAIGAWTRGGSARDAGHLAGLAIERAAKMAIANEVAGVVTAPIDKHALKLGGFDDPGHTEMFARLTGRPTVMMLASDKLRVVLATTHIALRNVPAAVTADAITRAAAITKKSLTEWFGITSPRLALCALNPHAGDGGRFGDEDDRILAPAARAAGIAGPFSADTVFVRAMRGEFDAVIAPYHDVGMTAIKVASFGSAVNITLGLPFVRTSPDHGTAIDIAGKGMADASSMKRAMIVAAEIAGRAG